MSDTSSVSSLSTMPEYQMNRASSRRLYSEKREEYGWIIPLLIIMAGALLIYFVYRWFSEHNCGSYSANNMNNNNNLNNNNNAAPMVIVSNMTNNGDVKDIDGQQFKQLLSSGQP